MNWKKTLMVDRKSVYDAHHITLAHFNHAIKRRITQVFEKEAHAAFIWVLLDSSDFTVHLLQLVIYQCSCSFCFTVTRSKDVFFVQYVVPKPVPPGQPGCLNVREDYVLLKTDIILKSVIIILTFWSDSRAHLLMMVGWRGCWKGQKPWRDYTLAGLLLLQIW